MTGFLIAGTSSGVGKTTVTLAITAALRRRGYVVQLFKGGPDFLDTSHHSRVSGRKSRNLDTWMFDHDGNRDVLRQASEGADIVLVEGMMGLFDGKSGSGDEGSSAEIAKLLKLPVVLVVDAGKSARSVAALVLGFEMFDPDLPIAGVILNRVASERHYKILEAAIIARCRAPVLGWLPRDTEISIPERHLGLQTAEESSEHELKRRAAKLAALAEDHLAVEHILSLTCDLDAGIDRSYRERVAPGLRIGVAYDAAFTFYYEDNLDMLRRLGAEIVFFSPMTDQDLPPMLDALILGGGYPELHVETLSVNQSMLMQVREFARSQRPIYAECGGMMYLSTSLTTVGGKTFNMAGVLPSRVEMTDVLRRFGYATVEFTQNCILGPAGTIIRGHSFHYSHITTTEEVSNSYNVTYSLSGRQEAEGFGISDTHVLASYIHLHFRSNPAVVEHFLNAATVHRHSQPDPLRVGKLQLATSL